MLTKRSAITLLLGLFAVLACGTMLWGVFSDALRPPGPQEWRRDLQAGDSEDRRAAAQRLGHVGPTVVDSVLPDLVRALKDREPSVRAMAAESLGDAVATAVPALRREEVAQPRASIQALLVALEEDQAQEVRTSAASALYLICHATERPDDKNGAPVLDKPVLIDAKAVASAFVAALRRDRETRSSLVPALGLLGPRLGEPPQELVKLLEDPSAPVRATVIFSLAHFPRGIDPAVPVLLHDLESSTFSDQADLQNTALRLKPTPAMLPMLTHSLGSSNPNVRRAAATMIGGLGPAAHDATPALLAALRASLPARESNLPGDRQDTAEIAKVLSDIGSLTEAVNALCEALHSENRVSRAAAAWALGNLGPGANAATSLLIQALKQALPNDRIPSDAAAEAYALGRIVAEAEKPSPLADEAIAVLTDALKSDVVFTRSWAVGALRRFGPRAAGAIPALRELYKKSDAQERRQIDGTLAEIEPPAR